MRSDKSPPLFPIARLLVALLCSQQSILIAGAERSGPHARLERGELDSERSQRFVSSWEKQLQRRRRRRRQKKENAKKKGSSLGERAKLQERRPSTCCCNICSRYAPTSKPSRPITGHFGHGPRQRKHFALPNGEFIDFALKRAAATLWARRGLAGRPAAD